MPDNEYNLMLQNDINKNWLSQWFFFWVYNTFKSQIIKFNILNLSKSDSHYNYRTNNFDYVREGNQTKGLIGSDIEVAFSILKKKLLYKFPNSQVYI